LRAVEKVELQTQMDVATFQAEDWIAAHCAQSFKDLEARHCFFWPTMSRGKNAIRVDDIYSGSRGTIPAQEPSMRVVTSRQATIALRPWSMQQPCQNTPPAEHCYLYPSAGTISNYSDDSSERRCENPHDPISAFGKSQLNMVYVAKPPGHNGSGLLYELA